MAVAAPVVFASEETKVVERLDACVDVLQEILGVPEDIPRDLLDKSYCVVVIPSAKKFALGLGGRYGKGAVVCRKDQGEGPWGAPLMVSIGGGSLGLQIGGQAADLVLLMMNPKGVNSLLKSQFTLGGDAAAAAGPKGRETAAETDATMGAEILTYARSKGLFAGVSLKGSVVKPDEEANRRLYGKAVTARQILEESTLQSPAAAEPFIAALTKYAPRNLSEKPPKTSATKR